MDIATREDESPNRFRVGATGVIVIPALNTVVYNEAHRIVGLLEDAATYCDELIVVDQGSTDGTGDLARDYGAVVIHDECRGLSELSYPLAAAHTENPFILILDADETLYPAKIPELHALDERWDGAWLARATFVDGVRLNTGADRHLRYYRQGCIQYATAAHHYNQMVPVKACYRSTPDPWVLHWKTSAEQVADDQRYDRLRLGATR